VSGSIATSKLPQDENLKKPFDLKSAEVVMSSNSFLLKLKTLS